MDPMLTRYGTLNARCSLQRQAAIYIAKIVDMIETKDLLMFIMPPSNADCESTTTSMTVERPNVAPHTTKCQGLKSGVDIRSPAVDNKYNVIVGIIPAFKRHTTTSTRIHKLDILKRKVVKKLKNTL
jgi:hypothetical protein